MAAKIANFLNEALPKVDFSVAPRLEPQSDLSCNLGSHTCQKAVVYQVVREADKWVTTLVLRRSKSLASDLLALCPNNPEKS
jgi:hypothetical protein